MNNFEQEVDEAIEAGELALASINKALEKLGNARGWGIFDLLGGGFISSILKHSNMNDAKYYIEQAKRD